MNTRVLLIEPLLDALGWDTRDLRVVTREYKVFDGKFLDYALKISGRPALFLEAKALGTKLDDPKVVAQTINYANNEGVTWCVLSDGQHYRVFKATEPVAMDRKLVFEVDLTDVVEDPQDSNVIEMLHLLSSESIATNSLADYISDRRVSRALRTLIIEPPQPFCDLISSLIPRSERNLSTAQIRASIKRILVSLHEKPSTPTNLINDDGPDEISQADPKKNLPPLYTFEYHFGKKPALVTDLYKRLHEQVMSLSVDIERSFRKYYVSYKIGRRSVLCVEPQQKRMKLFLSLDPKQHVHHLVRDVTHIGHAGTGNMEVIFESVEHLDQILEWITKAVADLSNSR